MPAKILPFDAAKPDPEVVADAAAALRAGKLVILPTETVYGLATNARDEDAIARLHEVKKRPEDKHLTRLIPDGSPLLERLPDGPSHRLARRFWPGPLTLVVMLEGQRLGFRVPEPLALRTLLLTAGCEVVATSANMTGQPPPQTAEQAIAALGDKVDLVLAGEPARLGEASTVVAINSPNDEIEILRQGSISNEQIFEIGAHLYLFVCTGNTCRSPMAEALLRHKLAQALEVEPTQLARRGWRVASAGTAAMPGMPANPHSVQTMSERDIDLSKHRSQPLALPLLAQSQRIFGLTASHVASIANIGPEFADKVALLDPEGIPDPFGGSLEEYRSCAERIEARIEELATILTRTSKP